MNCDRIRKHLADYSAGFLTGRIGEEVQAHLPHCPACRTHLEELRGVDRLAAADRVVAPEALVRRVMVQVRPIAAVRHVRRAWLLDAVGPILAAAVLLPVVALLAVRLLSAWLASPEVAGVDWQGLGQSPAGLLVVLGLALVAGTGLWMSKQAADSLVS